MKAKWYLLWAAYISMYILMFVSLIYFIFYREEAARLYEIVNDRYPIGFPLIFAGWFGWLASSCLLEKDKSGNTIYRVLLFSAITIYFLYELMNGVVN